MDIKPLWTPPAVERTRTFALMKAVNARYSDLSRPLASYEDLYEWSVQHPGAFWSMVWDEAGIIGDKGDEDVVRTRDNLCEWFRSPQLIRL